MRVTYAMWGNTGGQCPYFDQDYTCHKDVSILIEEKCKGKESCKIKASEDSFKDKSKLMKNQTTDERLAKCKELKNKMRLSAIITCECTKDGGGGGGGEGAAVF